MKVFVMTAGLTALFVVVGGALGGQQGMIVALLAASSYAPMAQVDPL